LKGKKQLMVATIHTIAFQGLDVRDIDVQVQLLSGLPAVHIVGLPDKAVAESRERVRGALHAMGIAMPAKRITINLAPADVVKEGSHFDLPIALAILVAMGILPGSEMAEYVALGELGLDAGIRTVTGVLPAALHAAGKGQGIICPEGCGGEAAWAGTLPILAPANLLYLVNHFKGQHILSRPEARAITTPLSQGPDMMHIRGQETAKRALEIAAAGGAQPAYDRPAWRWKIHDGIGPAVHFT
jgi:magnesium chelatase family protein